jgi:hypothetical protein
MDMSRRLEELAERLAEQDAAFAQSTIRARAAEHAVIVRAERVHELACLIEPAGPPSLSTHFVRI